MTIFSWFFVYSILNCLWQTDKLYAFSRHDFNAVYAFLSEKGISKTMSNESATKNRHSTSFQSGQSPTLTSQDAALPTTRTSYVYHITHNLVWLFYRRSIFRPLTFQLLLTILIVIICSLLKSWELAPISYLPAKNSVLNRYFAKFGWAWTMGLLCPFIYFRYKIWPHHLVRLLVATGVWYCITMTFVLVQSYTGTCKHARMRDASRRICVSGGYEWQEGHDVSGHIFLLLYAFLIIDEEVKSYGKGTQNMGQASHFANASGDAVPNINYGQLANQSNMIRVIYLALRALSILWVIVLSLTALYYHHTYEKIIGAILAVFFWYLTYHVWYRPGSPSLLRPSSPEHWSDKYVFGAYQK